MTLYSYGTCLTHRRQPAATTCKSKVIESFTNHGVEGTDGLKKKTNKQTKGRAFSPFEGLCN